MKILLFTGLLSVTIGLSACSPMNSDFSCHATASDQCLSIEEVNAMTDVDAPLKQKNSSSMEQGRAPYFYKHGSQTIWIAPWTDERGTLHTNDTLFANIESTSNQSTF